jgi:hypothetical protein
MEWFNRFICGFRYETRDRKYSLSHPQKDPDKNQ